MGKTRKQKHGKFWPPKYYAGLTRKQKEQRYKEIQSHKSKYHWSNSRAYTPFKTDKLAKTKKRSQYTEQWEKLFPDAKSIKERSKVTGVPEKYLKKVYDRASAAWLTGHRPGQTTQSWAYPRISSFLLCGKTHYTADADLVRKAREESKTAKKWFTRCSTKKPAKFNNPK
jgi:hypothetical protein